MQTDPIGSTVSSDQRAVTYLERVFEIIETMVREGEPIGPRPLSRASGVERNSTARVLRNLEDIDVVESNDGAYSLSSRFFELCRSGAALDAATDVLGPFVEHLVHNSGESAAVFRRSGDFAVPIQMLETDKAIRYVADYETHLPLYAGAPGRAILSTLSDAEVEDFLTRVTLTEITPGTITDPKKLWTRIRRTRRDGFCWSNAEAVDGGWGVAAPYFDASGSCVGAVSVLGPLSRPPQDKADLAEIVRVAALDLSARLGHRPD